MTTTSKQPTVVTQADWVSGPEQGEWTYDSYAALPDDEQRYEIIDGVLFTMPPPAPTPQHQRVGFRIAKRLSPYVDDADLGEVFISPLDVELAPKTVVQPDVFILLKANPAKITEKRIQGVPDLVVEVSSPGTVGHDRSVKQQAYERAGVREYWFVDPLAYTIEILILEAKPINRSAFTAESKRYHRLSYPLSKMLQPKSFSRIDKHIEAKPHKTT